MGDGAASAAEHARALAHRGLGDEVPEQGEVELGFAQPVVDAEGLRRERAMAFEAGEARNGAAVTAACEVALPPPAKVVSGDRGAIGARAMTRYKLHVRTPP